MQRRFPASWLLAMLASSAFGQIVPFTWTINGPDDLYANAANWQGGTAPQATDPTAQIRLLPGEDAIVLPAGNVTLHSLRYQGSTQLYRYTFESGSATTLNLLDGVTVDSGPSTYLQFDQSVTMALGADQLWRANYVTVHGAIGGPGGLTFIPVSYFASSYHDGWIELNGPGNFSGGFGAYDAWVYIGHPQALAGGPLGFADVDLNNSTGSDIVFAHPVTLSSIVRFAQWDHPDTTFVFEDTAVLAGSVALTNYGPRPVYFKDTIAESTDGSASLSLDGFFVFEGDNSEGAYTDGTFVNTGAAIYAHGSSVPAEGLISASIQGYVGAAFATGVQAKLLDHLDPEGFFGTLGFDTDPLAANPQVFAEDLDLSSLEFFRGLGSTTRAILSGELNLDAGQHYRFGGGGGILTVTSDLDRATSKVILDAPPFTPPLTVVLQGNNAFAGGVEVSRGILIFDGAGALPAGNTIDLIGPPAYAGSTENAADTPAQFLMRFNSLFGQGVVGFDSANPASPRTISEAIDLSRGGSQLTPYYLGTRTKVSLEGTLTPPGSQLFLTGIDGGHLVVNSVLGGSMGLVAGLIEPLGATPGIVELNGNNTFSGGTLLLSGTLRLGHANALGSGAFSSAGDDDTRRTLQVSTDLTLANSIHLEEDLAVGHADSAADLTLAGAFSGNGTLDYKGAGTLTIVNSGSLRHLEVDAAGTGSVVLANDARGLIADLHGGTLTFNGSRPHVRALNSEAGTEAVLGSGVALVFRSDSLGEGPIDNTLDGVISGDGRIVLDYGDKLLLNAPNTFEGGITLIQGLLVAGHDDAFGSGTITVARGNNDEFNQRLAASVPDLDIGNPIVLHHSLLLNSGDSWLPTKDLTLSGPISGAGRLGKAGSYTATLTGTNTFAGGVVVQEGTIEFASNHAAGTGPLSFAGENGGLARFTTSAPAIGGLSSFGSGYGVELADNAVLTVDQAENSLFSGTISGDGARLAKTGMGTLWLTGANTYTGGTQIDGGEIVFTTGALAGTTGTGTNRITVTAGGYAGIGSVNLGTAAFFAKFDPTATHGSLGFDSLNRNAPTTYTGAVNLASFNPSVRLASATAAVLDPAATITPAGDSSSAYRFGGGGGILFVHSPLDGSRAVDAVSSATEPFTLALLGETSYTGGTEATQSAVLFGPGALPPSGNLVLGPGGYIGSADPDLAPADFLARFPAGTDQGMIGFDTADPEGIRVIASPIDLGAFASGVYLGTHTRLALHGALTPASGPTFHRLGAYKGGELTVFSPLTGASTAVHVGDPLTLATFGDPSTDGDDISTVILAGANSYGGTTTLYSGRLLAGGRGVTSALGTGALVVQPHSLVYPGEDDLLPQFGVTSDFVVVPNALQLNSGLELLGTHALTLAGPVTGTAPLVKTGGNTLRLTGDNSGWSGGLVFQEGRLEIGHNQALGTGPFTIQGQQEDLIVAHGGARTLANPLIVDGGHLSFGGAHNLTLAGPVQLEQPVTHLGVYGGNPNLTVFIADAIGGNDRALFASDEGTFWLTGANTYTGGTRSEGRIVFGSVASIPASGALGGSYTDGYIGLALPSAGLQADFIDRFQMLTNGTIGFDTAPGAAQPNVFSADIDLTHLSNGMRLGSTSAAVLSGEITPSDNVFRFGDGGGQLTVASDLADGETTRSLNLYTQDVSRPLLVRLTGDNSYSGGTHVDNSALIFASADSLPANGSLSMGIDGYIGYEDPTLSFASLIARFSSGQPFGVIGIDSVDPQNPRTLSSPSLAHFASVSSYGIALGTATAAVIDGTITLPAGQHAYQFSAVRDGRLTVNATLAGSQGVEINGHNFTGGRFNPTVVLGGANPGLTGDTTLVSGRLVVAHASALGSGDLVVPYSGNQRSTLELTVPSLANDIQIGGPLAFAGSSNATLSGVLSGYFDLVKQDAFALTLSGANASASGLISIRGGTVNFAHDTAAGDGEVQLTFEQAGGAAHFSTASPVIAGLTSAPGVDAVVSLGQDTTLKVNTAYTYQDDTYAGVITGEGGLDKAGAGTLRLSGANTYESGTAILGGSLVAAHASALGEGGVTLDGGSLVVAPGISLGNAISFGSNGGLLGGSGVFSGPVSLGPDAVLAPGNSIGTLHFGSDLTWGPSAFFDFEVQDPLGAPGIGYDRVVVAGTLEIASNLSSPFTFNLIPLDPHGNPSGTLNGFDALRGYSWLVASAAEIEGFEASHFFIDDDAFGTTLLGGSFHLSVTGSDLFLNFTPVPEPSTYVLMIAGLGLMLVVWRRRRS